MIKTVTYMRVPEEMCLGRNRFFHTAGIDVYGDGNTVYLEPRTGKNVGSSACRVVVPIEDALAVASALQDVFEAGRRQDIVPDAPPPQAGRLARLVATWRGQPHPVDA
jgi:hypothetical protein